MPRSQPVQSQAQYFAHSAFDAIAPRGLADVSADRDGKPTGRRRVRRLSVNKQDEQWICLL